MPSTTTTTVSIKKLRASNYYTGMSDEIHQILRGKELINELTNILLVQYTAAAASRSE